MTTKQIFVAAIGLCMAGLVAVIEMTATGGVLVLGISLLLLDLRRVRVGNLMPAVLLAPLIVDALQALHINY